MIIRKTRRPPDLPLRLTAIAIAIAANSACAAPAETQPGEVIVYGTAENAYLSSTLGS